MIRVFGDSHRARFAHYDKRNSVPRISVHGMAGLTAHGMGGGEGLAVIGLNSGHGVLLLQETLLNVREEDVILFVAGEVDCRIHFYYWHRETGEPIETLIDRTVMRYGSTVASLNYQTAVLDAIPAVRQGNVYDLKYYATREVRAEITQMFNARLKDFCREAGVPFIEVFPLMADERGFLRDDLAEGDAHAKPSTVELVDLAKHYPGATWSE